MGSFTFLWQNTGGFSRRPFWVFSAVFWVKAASMGLTASAGGAAGAAA